jgi:hypothetical protein
MWALASLTGARAERNPASRPTPGVGGNDAVTPGAFGLVKLGIGHLRQLVGILTDAELGNAWPTEHRFLRLDTGAHQAQRRLRLAVGFKGNGRVAGRPRGRTRQAPAQPPAAANRGARIRPGWS